MRSVEEVARWIIENRRGKAFKDYSPLKILTQITECIEHDSMVCITEGSSIVGVVCCEKDDVDKIMFVHDVLTTKKGVLKRMVEYFMKTFPGYTLRTFRKNKTIQFNDTQKLYNRL